MALLRSLTSSQECNTWKLATRLQSPSRFPEFVQGSPPLTENEVMDYSHAEFSTDQVEAMTDDEDEGGDQHQVNGYQEDDSS